MLDGRLHLEFYKAAPFTSICGPRKLRTIPERYGVSELSKDNMRAEHH
jgi:hypothetical protein